MQRLTSLGVLASAAVVAGLVPAMAVEGPATPTREIVATPQADDFTPTPHPTVRIVLGDSGFATTTNVDGSPKCLPKDLPVELTSSAVTLTPTTIQVDYKTWQKVRAVIAGDHTADTAFMPRAASYSNEVGVADIEFDKGFVDGNDELVVTLCVEMPDPATTSPTR